MTDEEIYKMLVSNGLIKMGDDPFLAIRVYKFGVIEGHKAFAKKGLI